LTGDCATLDDCCDLLDPADAQLCHQLVQGADQAVCQSILDQIQAQGACL
jgi:hypothetical protein